MGSKTKELNKSFNEEVLQKKSVKIMPTGIKTHKRKHITSTVDKSLHRSRNSSVMTKKSLRANNRALAKCLSREKRETRDLNREIARLIAERFELHKKINQFEAEHKNFFLHLDKIAKLKIALNQVTGNVLGTVELIKSVVDLFKDVNVDSVRSSSTGSQTNTRNTVCENDVENRIETAEIRNPDDETSSLNDIELPRRCETSVSKPQREVLSSKEVFDLTGISEHSYIESAHTSFQNFETINNCQRSKSVDKRETRSQTRRTRSRELSNRLSIDPSQTPRTPDIGQKFFQTPPNVPTEVFEEQEQNSLQSQNTGKLNFDTNHRKSLLKERSDKLSSEMEKGKDSQKERKDKVREEHFSSPSKALRFDHRPEQPSESSRRGTFVVPNSLQIAPWPPVDLSSSNFFVATRKSSKSSSSTNLILSDVEKKSSLPIDSTIFKEQGFIVSPNKQFALEHEITDLRLLDMEFTIVSDLHMEDVLPAEEKSKITTNVQESKTETKGNISLKSKNQQPFLILEDCINTPKNKEELKRKASNSKTPLVQIPILKDGDCYDCSNVVEEPIDALGKYNDWKSRRTSETVVKEQADGNAKSPTEKRLQQVVEKVESLYENNKKKRKVKPKTPKQITTPKQKVALKTPKEKPAPKTPKEKAAPKTPKEKAASKTPKKKIILNDKENDGVNERSRRTRAIVDYKLPTLKSKIRRDRNGKTVDSADIVSDPLNPMSFID